MRIAITGIGIVSAIGNNVNETLYNLENEVSGIVPIESTNQNLAHELLNGLPVGIVRQDNVVLSDELGIDTMLPRTVLLGIKAAREALAMSGCASFAFVNGNTVGGMDITEKYYAGWRKGEDCVNIKSHDVGTCTRLIADNLEGVGYRTTISTACSSALNSIIDAANLIRSKRETCVLAGGTECLTKFHLLGFRSLSILANDRCRPFDLNRKGINLGEGAAYIVMEDEELARERGAVILGYVSGYGNACDAYHQTASSPDGKGAYIAMSKALEMACRKPGEIDYINAHGTSTVDNDKSESAAIKRLFGENYPLISSTKGFTGHTTSASGSIDSVVSLISMLNGIVPANLNWKCADADCVTPVCNTLRRKSDVIMCNAFGFGGNDSSVVFESVRSDVRQLDYLKSVLIRETAKVEYSDGYDYSSWIKPIDARRLSKQMRLIVAAALSALSDSGIETPDAVVAATVLGAVGNTRCLLDCMANDDAVSIKPSSFMYSTHNSVASLLAVKLHCHGNNCTISNAEYGEYDARLYAEMLVEQGEANSVLLLSFDEDDDVWDSLMDSQNLPHRSRAEATVLIKE